MRFGIMIGLCCAAAVGAGAETTKIALAQTELRLYESPHAFQDHMARRMAAAMAHGPQLVMFPEDIGLPLALVDDYETVKRCETAAEAMGVLARQYGAEIAPLMAGGLSPARALLKLRGPRIEALYRETFAELARRHRVFIVAGSAPLPHLDGQCANVSCLFGPGGEVLARTVKSHLVALEGPQGLDLVALPREQQAVWQTPLGPLGMIICADAWDAGIAQAHKQAGARLLLNCLANPEPWSEAQQQGMDGGSLPARVAETGLPGAQCYAVGSLFELHFRGKSQILRPLKNRGWEATARAEAADREEIVAGEVVL